MPKNELLHPRNVESWVAMDFNKLAPMAIQKIKTLGAVLELPAKQHC